VRDSLRVAEKLLEAHALSLLHRPCLEARTSQIGGLES